MKTFQRITKITLGIIIIAISSCNQGSKDLESIEVDYIKYNVFYMENMAGDIPTSILPNEMHAYFTKNHVLTEIKGMFGQFRLVQIANLKKNTVISMLNFLGNKIYFIGEKGEIPIGIHPLDDPKIDFTEDTLTISGLKSYRVAVQLPDQSYDIYYTDEIDIKNPNITTPYAFIDNVLSDFRVQLSYLKMRIILEEYKKETVNPSLFEIPEDYEQVTRETMNSIINNLFTKD